MSVVVVIIMPNCGITYVKIDSCGPKNIKINSIKFSFIFYVIKFLLNLGQKVKVNAVCGSYNIAALRHIVFLPE